MLGWLLSAFYLAVLVWLRLDWLNFSFSLGLILIIAGLALGNLIPTLDKQFLQPIYGGAGLLTRSLLFVGTLLPVALFVVSSTGSELGTGLVMGFLFNTTSTWWSWRAKIEVFNREVFFQFSRQLRQQEINILIGALSLILGLLVNFSL